MATVARALADAGSVRPVNAPAGGLAGAWLVARVIKRATPRAPLRGAARLCARAARPSRPLPPPPPAAKSVKFTLHAAAEDVNGDHEDFAIAVSVTSQDELEKLERKHGGGSLTLEGSITAATFDDLVEGGKYTLVGGQNGAFLNKRKWTQVSDLALEAAATEAVREAAAAELGETVVLNNTIITDGAGAEREFDGLLVSAAAATAIFVEAKHKPELKHLTIVADKLTFLERAARAGGDARLAGVARILPVLAGNLFSAEMAGLCRRDGVGVVRPNGRAFSLELPRGFGGARRGLCTAVRLARLTR